MNKFPEDPIEIERVCKKYNIWPYRIEEGLVHVKGNVSLYNKNLVSIPVRFGVVNGWFDCGVNNLTSLEGSPIECKHFYCRRNRLTSLVGAPIKGPIDFVCDQNHLTSLVGAPDKVESFSCWDNPLRSLEGLPLANVYTINGTRFEWITDNIKEFLKLVAFGKEFDLSMDEIYCISEENTGRSRMIRLLDDDSKKKIRVLSFLYKIACTFSDE